MADYTHSSPIDIIPKAPHAHPTTLAGTPQSAAGKLGVQLSVFHGFIEAAANTNAGKFLIQTTPDSAGNFGWVTTKELRTFSGTPDEIVLTDGEPGGETVIAVGSTTGFEAGQVCVVEGPFNAYEWVLLQEISAGTSVTVVDPLSFGHGNGDSIWNEAQVWSYFLDLKGVERYRVIYFHEGATGADVVIWVRGVEISAIE